MPRRALAAAVAVACALAIATIACAQDAVEPRPSLEDQFQALNLADARKWEMFLDAAQQKKAELVERPIFVWTNPTKNKGQHGAVFVWTHEARPMVVGSIFIDCTLASQRMMHEFHSLSTEVLHPRCQTCEGDEWQPKAGITIRPLPASPQPETTPAKRLLQIRAIGREFGGYEYDNWRKLRWELRTLPQPLYRYDQATRGISDGAILALVNDAGTDPEVLLLLEARENAWHYALMRFSDATLHVEYQGKEVWSAIRGPDEQQFHNADHTYQFLRMRYLDPSETIDITPKQ
jgi:hypothetical protein